MRFVPSPVIVASSELAKLQEWRAVVLVRTISAWSSERLSFQRSDARCNCLPTYECLTENGLFETMRGRRGLAPVPLRMSALSLHRALVPRLRRLDDIQQHSNHVDVQNVQLIDNRIARMQADYQALRMQIASTGARRIPAMVMTSHRSQLPPGCPYHGSPAASDVSCIFCSSL